MDSNTDRFQLETAADFSRNFTASSRINRDEDGYPDALVSAAGYTCQNCGETVDGVSLVPEFEYLGCDECMEEALKVIAREAAELREFEACRGGVIPMQGELFLVPRPMAIQLLESVSDLMLDEGVA